MRRTTPRCSRAASTRPGLTDFRNLLTTENQLLAARNALVGAEADRASAFVRLTQALGGG